MKHHHSPRVWLNFEYAKSQLSSCWSSELPRHRVRVLLRGGLGNQLFQLAAGWVVAARQGDMLEVDESLVRLRGTSDRPALLDHFIWPSVAGQPVYFTCSEWRASRPYGLARRIRRKWTGRVTSRLWLDEARGNRAWQHHAAHGSGIRHVDGYFQEPALVAVAEAHGFPASPRLIEPSEQFLHDSRQLAEVPTAGVHIRLGDFTKLGWSLPPEWYAVALKSALHAKPVDECWIFSDSPAQLDPVLTLLGTSFPAVTFKKRRPRSDVTAAEDLVLLSRTDPLITGPGTFAWWARHWASAQGASSVGP